MHVSILPQTLPIQANFRLYFKQSFLFCVCVWVAQLCLTLCELTNCSPSGSSVLDGFSRQEYWRRNTFPSPGNLPNPGIEHQPLILQADSGKPISLLGELYIQHLCTCIHTLSYIDQLKNFKCILYKIPALHYMLKSLYGPTVRWSWFSSVLPMR